MFGGYVWREVMHVRRGAMHARREAMHVWRGAMHMWRGKMQYVHTFPIQVWCKPGWDTLTPLQCR